MKTKKNSVKKTRINYKSKSIKNNINNNVINRQDFHKMIDKLGITDKYIINNSSKFCNNFTIFLSIIKNIIDISNQSIPKNDKIQQIYHIQYNKKRLFSTINQPTTIINSLSKIKSKLNHNLVSQSGGFLSQLIAGTNKIDNLDYIFLILSTIPIIGLIPDVILFIRAIIKANYRFALSLFFSIVFMWIGLGNAKWVYISSVANVKSNDTASANILN